MIGCNRGVAVIIVKKSYRPSKLGTWMRLFAFPFEKSKNPSLPLPATGFGGARGVMVIVVGNGHGDTSSNPGRD